MQIGQKVSLRLDTIGVEHFKGFSSALLGQIPYGMVIVPYDTCAVVLFCRVLSTLQSSHVYCLQSIVTCYVLFLYGMFCHNALDFAG